MRAIAFDTFGLAHLKVVDRPTPEPARGEVRVRMLAAALNYRDLLMVRGEYNPRQRLPLVPLSDGCGVVESVGFGVTRFKPGERVAPIFAQRWLGGEPSRRELGSTLGGPLDGTLAEFCVFSEDGLVSVPEHLSNEAASTLPCAALTAWSALAIVGRVRAGDIVLVQGTGGVSLFALQFAQLLGANVIATSSSDEKMARLRALGAWETIHYRSIPEWGKRAKELTGGRGVDHVIDVGGAATLAQSIVAVRPFGTVSVIGMLGGRDASMPVTPVLMQNIRIQGVLVGHREGFESMNRAIAQHRLEPVIDRVYPFAEARDAFERLASGAHTGKICVCVNVP